MMQKMGFARRWVNWIMTCVTSVRYTIKFNGTLLDSFAPSHGLRQGDPLFPFLFLFVADWLYALLKDGDNRGNYTPLTICKLHLLCPIYSLWMTFLCSSRQRRGKLPGLSR